MPENDEIINVSFIAKSIGIDQVIKSINDMKVSLESLSRLVTTQSEALGKITASLEGVQKGFTAASESLNRFSKEAVTQSTTTATSVADSYKKIQEASRASVTQQVSDSAQISRMTRQQTQDYRSAMAAANAAFKSPGVGNTSISGIVSGYKNLSQVLKDTSVAGMGTSQSLSNINNNIRQNLSSFSSFDQARIKVDYLKRSLNDLTTQMITTGKQMQWVGRQLFTTLTLPVVGFGVEAVKAFTQVNQQMVVLQQNFGPGFAQNAQSFNTAIDQISHNFAQMPAQTAQIMANWASVFKNANDLKTVTQEVSRVSLLGNVDPGQATDLFRSVMNNFSDANASVQTQLAQTSNIMNQFNAITRVTPITLSQIAQNFGQVATVAEDFGVSASQAVGVMASMQSKGIDVSQAGQGLRLVLSQLADPSTAAAKALKQVNISLDGLTGPEKIQALAQGIEKLREAGKGGEALQLAEQAVGKRQASRFLAFIDDINQGIKDEKAGIDSIQQTQSTWLRSQLAAGQSPAELAALAQKNLQQVQQSPAFKFQQFKADLNDFLKNVGASLAPTLENIMKHLENLMNAFQHLSPGVREAIAGFAIFLAGLSPVIIALGISREVVGEVGKGFLALIPGLKSSKAGMEEIKGVFGLVGDNMVKLKAPTSEVKNLFSDMPGISNKVKEKEDAEAKSHLANAYAIDIEKRAAQELNTEKFKTAMGGVFPGAPVGPGKLPEMQLTDINSVGGPSSIWNRIAKTEGKKGGKDLIDEFAKEADKELSAGQWINGVKPPQNLMQKFLGKIPGVGGSGGVLGMLGLGGEGASEGGALAGITGAFDGIGGAAAAAAGPVALVVGAIAAAIGLVPIIAALSGHWKDFAAGVKQGWNDLQQSFSKFWKEIQPGVDAIGKAFGQLWNAIQSVGKSIASVFSSLVGTNDKHKSSTKDTTQSAAQDWQKAGSTIGGVLSAIAKGIEMAGQVVNVLMQIFAKVIGFVADVVSAMKGYMTNFFRPIADMVGLVAALFQGNWGQVWAYAIHTVYDVFVGPLVQAFQTVVEVTGQAVGAILDIIAKLASAAGHLPFIGGTFKSWAKDIKGWASDVKQYTSGLNWDQQLRDMLPKTKPVFDLNMDINVNRNIKAGKTNVDPSLLPVGAPTNMDSTGALPGKDSGTGDTRMFDNFLSALKEQLNKQIQDASDAATKNLKDAHDAIIQMYDDQIKKIQDTQKADDEQTKEAKYNADRRKLLSDYELNMQNYQRQRALDIYEGKIDDARALDLNFQKTTNDHNTQLQDLDQQHQQDIRKQQQDAQIQQLNDLKAAKQKEFSIEEETFKKELGLITQFTPRTLGEMQNMLDAINGLLRQYGAPTIQGGYEAALNTYKTAVNMAKKGLENDWFWSGHDTAAAWLAGFASVPMDEIFSAIRKKADKAGITGAGGDASSPVSDLNIGNLGGAGFTGSVASLSQLQKSEKDIIRQIKQDQQELKGPGVFNLNIYDKAKVQQQVNTLYGFLTSVEQQIAAAKQSDNVNIGSGVTFNPPASTTQNMTNLANTATKTSKTTKDTVGKPVNYGGITGLDKSNASLEKTNTLLFRYVTLTGFAKAAVAGWVATVLAGGATIVEQITVVLNDITVLNNAMVAQFTQGFKDSGTVILKGWSDVIQIWNGAMQSLLQIITQGWTNIDLVEQLQSGNFKEAMSTLWSQMLFDTTIKWNEITKAIQTSIFTIVSNIQAGVTGIGNAWSAIKGQLAKPINWVIQNVLNAFIFAIDSISNATGGGVLLKPVSKVPEQHTGGIIGDDKGKMRSAIPSTDEQLTMLQRGEGVLSRKAMSKLGKSNFHALNSGKGIGDGTGKGDGTGGPDTETEIEALMHAIRDHESGGNYRAVGNGEAFGAYQYIDSTWGNYGGFHHASDAPPAVQDAKAHADIMGKLAAYGGDFAKVAASWYYPAWAGNPNLWDQVPMPGHGNTLTIRQFVTWIMDRMNQYLHLPPGTNLTASDISAGGMPQQFDFTAQKQQIFGALMNQLRAMGPYKQLGQMLNSVSTRLAGGIINWINGKENGGGAPGAVGDPGQWLAILAQHRGNMDFPWLIQYMQSTGVPFSVNSTFRPNAITVNGTRSYHADGRAVDFGDGHGGRDSSGLAAIFRAFGPVESDLAELIFADAPYNIKNGRRVAPYNSAQHHDHVHAALAEGGIVKSIPGGMLARLGEGRLDEMVMPLPSGATDAFRTLTTLRKVVESGFMPAASSPASILNTISSDIKKAETLATNAATAEGGATYHFHVDTFIGEPEWFEKLIDQYNATAGAKKTRATGAAPRKITSFKDSVVRYR